MKKIMMALAAALMLAACDSKEADDFLLKIEDPDSMAVKEITFTFPDVTQSAFTRSSLSEAQMTDLWLFDYIDGELSQSIHKTSSDDGFGSISLSADYGTHTFYFVASRGGSPEIDGTTITWEIPRDTFWATLTMNIQPSSASSTAVSLSRVATRLRITVTDEVPANLAQIVVTPATWYYGLDYTTGDAVSPQISERTVNVPESYAGTSGQLIVNIFGLCGDDFTTDVTVTAKDGDESAIGSVTIPDVPMSRNRTTSFSGGLFGTTRSMTFSVDDEWEDDHTSTW